MDERDKRKADTTAAQGGAEEPTDRAPEPQEQAPEPDERPAAEQADEAGEGDPEAEERTPQGEQGETSEQEVAEPEIVEEPEKTEADELREQLEAAQARLRVVSKAYTDLQQEMKSFRSRMESQLEVRQERQAFDLVKGFFDPVMNLKRSIANHGDDMKLLLEGLGMVHHQFMTALENLGLEKVPGEGAEFDPNLHEALAVTPVTDPDQDGKVLMVHADGYAVKGKVLQAAQVVIGKYEAPQGEA